MKRCGIGLSLLLAACGLPGVALPPDLATQQPRVEAATPAAGAVVDPPAEIRVRFSQPVDPDSVHAESFAVVTDVASGTNPAGIVEAWRDGAVPPVPGTYAVTADGLEARLTPAGAIRSGEAGAACAVIVTTVVRSVAGIPLSQTPGEGAMPFVSLFTVRGEAASAVDGTTVAPPEIGMDPGTNGTTDGNTATVPQRIVPAELMINEVYYDAVGPDTNGVLFVELRGTPEADVGGYRCHFVNGDGGILLESMTIPAGVAIPADGLLVIGDGMTGNLQVTQVAEADLVDNFDPQNGPDAVQLVDPDGKIVDAVGYGNPLTLYGENGLPLYEIAPGPDAPAGQSISRLPGAPDTDNNAVDFIVLETPTPGKE